MQFDQLLLNKLLVPVKLSARSQELFDLGSVLNSADRSILKTGQLLILKLADAVFKQLDLQVFLHYLFSLRLLNMHIFVLGRCQSETKLSGQLTAVVICCGYTLSQLLDSILKPDLFLSELLAHLSQELFRCLALLMVAGSPASRFLNCTQLPVQLLSHYSLLPTEWLLLLWLLRLATTCSIRHCG